MPHAVWERHANPWSVWTRVATGWLVLPIVWSHTSLGLAAAGGLLAAFALWMWLNPRLFARPATTTSWASKVTFGERVWLREVAFDDLGALLAHHRMATRALNVVTGVGALTGLIAAGFNDLTLTVAGGIVMFGGKLWFGDRMVWLYEDAARMNPEIAAWTR